MKFSFHRRTALVNGTLVVLLVGGAAYGYISLASDGNAGTAAAPTGAVARGTVMSSVSASGSVVSAKSRDLSFGTSGTVKRIEVQTGDKVVKGEVLARLDATAAQENVTVTKAALDAADDDTSTAQAYSSYVSARNSYNAALRQLDATVLKAPFAGTVTAVNGTVGGSSGGSAGTGTSGTSGSGGSGGGSSGASGGSGGAAGSGSSSGSSTGSSSGGFITVADTGRLAVTANFTEADTTKLKLGQTATVSFDALTGVTAAGKVTAIDMSSTTTGNVVQYGVTVSLTGRPAGIRLGQTTSVQVIVSKAAGVLYVPTAAVRTVGGQSSVTVLRDGKQVVTPVQIGVKGDQGTEIKSGLTAGERVVLSAGTGTGGVQLPGGGRFPGGGLGGGGLGGGGARAGGGGRG
ncbi:efflux RND transporter periplasmic adaptor subunit [Actinomadura scrupuli]|uniref:efflux RND transporter periplasmic adaptor subunit n=1 Tax=Actinomadura scrupuli TaxID=559629 RepID=UPI003D96FD15